MKRLTLFGMVLLGLISAPAFAARIVTIDLGGNHEFMLGSGLHDIPIMAVGGESITLDGVQLFVQIGDGSDAPAITGLDVTYAGSLFAGNNTGNNVIPEGTPGFTAWEGRQTLTSSGTVTLNTTPSLLAMLTVDANGPRADTWNLVANNTLAGSSVLTPYPDLAVSMEFVNGSITLLAVPEPIALVQLLAMLSTVGVGMLFVRKKRRAAMSA